MGRLRRKLETARNTLPEPIVDFDPNKKVGIISFGSNDPAVQEARDRLSADNIETNYLRIRALPLRQEVIDFALNHDRVYVIENNFDGQMAQLIYMETRKDTSHIVSLASGDGLPMSPRFVHQNILREERK
jgi:2-oxoglutarate ferredoxin oxidoreductase subunit alpha